MSFLGAWAARPRNVMRGPAANTGKLSASRRDVVVIAWHFSAGTRDEKCS